MRDHGAALRAKSPISLVFAIPDHPWYKSTDSAAVRIAMTVGVAGNSNGQLQTVVSENDLDSDAPEIVLQSQNGEIHSDLTIGVDVTTAQPLKANGDIASMGPALGGRGFVVSRSLAEHLNPTRASVIKKLTTGKDITNRHRDRYAIDVRDFSDEQTLRSQLPKIYQHLLDTVYPVRKSNSDPKLRKYWWRFRRSNETYFGAIAGLRPEYQTSILREEVQRPELELGGIAAGQESEDRTRKPTFPTDNVSQTATIIAMLAQSSSPIGASAIAKRFRQGRRVQPRISAVLAALERLGFVVDMGSNSYLLGKMGGAR